MEMFRGTGGPVNTIPGATGSPYLTDTAELWGRRKSKSEELKESHQGEWTRNWKWYLAHRQAMTDPQDWWRSNVADPEAFKIIETLLPNLILGMFQSQEWFTVKGRERNDAELARKVQSLLMYMADRMELFPKLYECLKYALIMGHAWGKVTWKIEVEDRIRNVGMPIMDAFGGIAGVRNMRVNEPHEVYNDPHFEWLMLDKVWCDPTGQGRWYMEQIETTLDQLNETNDQLGIYKNLSLVAGMGDHTSEGEPFDEEKDGFGYSGTQTEPAMVDGTKVVLSQCWGWVPPDLRGPDGAAYRLTVIANGLVEIRDEPIPTPDNRPPYFPIKTVPVPGRLFGASILKWIGPQIDVKARLANMRVDEVSLGIWQQFVSDRDAVGSNQMLMQPGGNIAVDTMGGTRSIRDVFAVIDRKPIMQEAYVEDGVRQRMAEDTAAATNLQQGVADSSRQSATEIMSLRSKGDARFVLQTMWLDATVKKQILERGFKYYQKQLPPNRMIRIIGTDYEDTVDISEIQVPHDIIVDAGIQAFTREARIQSVSEFVQLANSEQFGPWFKKSSSRTSSSRSRWPSWRRPWTYRPR
jgi:hypothetical protein